jgi:hypothetical protein
MFIGAMPHTNWLATALLRDERRPVTDPWVDYELPRLALELAHHGVYGRGKSRHNGRRMGIHKRRQLITIAAAEGTNVDRHANLLGRT